MEPEKVRLIERTAEKLYELLRPVLGSNLITVGFVDKPHLRLYVTTKSPPVNVPKRFMNVLVVVSVTGGARSASA